MYAQVVDVLGIHMVCFTWSNKLCNEFIMHVSVWTMYQSCYYDWINILGDD